MPADGGVERGEYLNKFRQLPLISPWAIVKFFLWRLSSGYRLKVESLCVWPLIVDAPKRGERSADNGVDGAAADI